MKKKMEEITEIKRRIKEHLRKGLEVLSGESSSDVYFSVNLISSIADDRWWADSRELNIPSNNSSLKRYLDELVDEGMAKSIRVEQLGTYRGERGNPIQAYRLCGLGYTSMFKR